MIEIIPAIDIINGECVRLTQGDYAQKTIYARDPVEMALRFEGAGLRRVHLVDLDGAKASEPRNLAVLERVAAATGLDIEWGGGVKSEQALESVFSAGAHRAICGSVAVSAPDDFADWLKRFGAAKIILGADIKDGRVATHGWLKESRLTAEELIERFVAEGLTQAIVTDISRDGMLAGPAVELYENLQAQFPAVDITASGGIGEMDDIRRLDAIGIKSVIVGKAIYENKITL